MITIQNSDGHRGYPIHVSGQGEIARARDVTEAAVAVLHYFGLNGHSRQQHPQCPICREIRRDRGMPEVDPDQIPEPYQAPLADVPRVGNYQEVLDLRAARRGGGA